MGRGQTPDEAATSPTKTTADELEESEEHFALLVESVRDYAIFMLDPEGHIVSWNLGAERIKGYQADEILGRHFSIFYPPEAVETGHPRHELELATQHGRYHEEGWRVRKDGSRFVADVTITALWDQRGQLRGFGKVTRDVTERKRAEDEVHALNIELEQRVRERTAALEASRNELEAFSYSVSHDLRAPLRGIDGFARILLEKYAPSLDEKGRNYLERIRAGTQRMGTLIDDLLRLSRLSRGELRWLPVDLGAVAGEVCEELRQSDPQRKVEFHIARPVRVKGDPHLLRVALENLLGNAWKFTSTHPTARIEFGCERCDDERVFFVRDDGAGFDMAYAEKLFSPFQRLHDQDEFEGTGVGLATVLRIIHRHGGRIWAEAQPDQGATFWFTLGSTA